MQMGLYLTPVKKDSEDFVQQGAFDFRLVLRLSLALSFCQFFLNTGLCTLEEEEKDERSQAIQFQKGIRSLSFEEQHLMSRASASFDTDNVISNSI